MSNKIKRLEEFRKGVDELRATLTLGLMHQSIRRPGLSSSELDVFVLRVTPSFRYSRLWYKQYSVNILVGSLWIRRSTPKVEQASNSSTSRLEVIECFGFYPAAWVSRLGLWHGVEANLHWASTAGWKFNISVITAVPEDALIFDFCREGNIGDKQALVYEGPTKDALTPITIWSERSHTMTSTQKINMMRLFGSECLDISEASGDGWLVSHNISSSMGQEKCRMSETSIHWLYNQKQTDVLISFSPNTVWHAIQQAIDGFDPIPLAERAKKRDASRLLRVIYSTWAGMSSKILGNAEVILRSELDFAIRTSPVVTGGT
ncbi:hypothetical protein GQ53DRAFT_757698 [Thozetella sp. PMI_491]|nr:hypothetical protein GQ53DRAFT_757698 [Thozetella sp. PMI_491]